MAELRSSEARDYDMYYGQTLFVKNGVPHSISSIRADDTHFDEDIGDDVGDYYFIIRQEGGERHQVEPDEVVELVRNTNPLEIGYINIPFGTNNGVQYFNFSPNRQYKKGITAEMISGGDLSIAYDNMLHRDVRELEESPIINDGDRVWKPLRFHSRIHISDAVRDGKLIYPVVAVSPEVCLARVPSDETLADIYYREVLIGVYKLNEGIAIIEGDKDRTLFNASVAGESRW